jgi:MFS family permease
MARDYPLAPILHFWDNFTSLAHTELKRMITNKMTATERRSVFNLSFIMALRMVGLFMVLPVFTLYAQTLEFATPTLIGMAIGVYGLSQALFQIPFGALSDRLGRKPMILTGLIIFIVGSMVAASTHSIYMMILGRALQGVGAVGSTILAMMADLTREEQRTKSMAIAGISIGFSFSIAMFLGPMLTKWMAVNQLFYIAALFGSIGIIVLFTAVPTPIHTRWHRDAEPEWRSFIKLLIAPELAKLNIGIFILHAIFTASFVVIPVSLKQFADLPSVIQWHYYLPALLMAFVVCIVCIGMAEKKQQIKEYFLAGITVLLLAELLFATSQQYILLALCLFFTGFTLLEAFLPSLVSRTAPAARKGSAMGIYSSAQFSGIFVGGVCGGWLFGHASFTGVYVFCLSLACIWLLIAFFMQPPRLLVTQMLRVTPNAWEKMAAQLNAVPGIVEATFVPEDGIAYLKMDRAAAKSEAFMLVKEMVG